ncbi:alpha/beta hydrolase [Halobacillus litoralis]|uniref:alpha/beta hydrolase n=1 Tax=Halobacillus litoralis TaxID=45668 RepID=UPI001CFE7B62|nr:alpha/beta hydrolase [Halobacillus litoralis]
MLSTFIARLLRLFPNQAEKTPMVPIYDVKKREDIIVDTSVEPTLITVYYPYTSIDKNHPVYINFHGGAFIMNDKEMDDPYCRFLTKQTGCVVFNINYSKAPEYPFPKPIEQSYEILQWIKKNSDMLNIDPQKIMVGGQSSGANIAAALCLHLKEHEEDQPLLQILSYPMLDFVTPHADKPEPDPWRAKYPQPANFLNKCYVPEKAQASHPLASPVRAERVDRLASALILIAEYDAFRPEAEYYAEKLKAAQVRVKDEVFRNCYHAFTHLGPKEKAMEAWNLIADEINEVTGGLQKKAL